MRILIEGDVYEGSPADIIDDLREQSFQKDDFPNTESFLHYMRDNFIRMTDMPCVLPEGTVDVRARAMLERLAEAGALEILEEPQPKHEQRAMQQGEGPLNKGKCKASAKADDYCEERNA